MIKAFITSYQCVEIRGRNKKYHTYRIEIHHKDEVLNLDRRYSDFLQLHKELRKQFGSDIPCFPPKKVRNSSVKVLESRRTSLEHYLQTMLTFSPIPKEVLGFLNIHNCRNQFPKDDSSSVSVYSEDHYQTESTIINHPAAGFVEDPFIESDTSSNLSDTVTRGVLDALYNI
ncbi:unnamed protein product [Orchesella dallaii]|uniref:PX domain-containing protein n=1 Tax=Orchesella dallaii TaxID=48710 RepID=A0ABP1S4U5_9HEXA